MIREIENFLERNYVLADGAGPEDLKRKRRLVAHGTQTAESYVMRMAEGKYTFGRHEEIGPQEVSHGIEPALEGTEVKKVSFISLKEPFPRPEFMTEDGYLSACREGINLSIGSPLSARLDSCWESRHGAMAGQLIPTPMDPLCSTVLEGMRRSAPVILELGNSRSMQLLDRVCANYRAAFLYYYTSLLAGDESAVNRLKGLLNLMAKCVPLGEKSGSGEAGHWLVLKPEIGGK